MDKKEFEKKVLELKKKRGELFTDEIRNSDLYNKLNTDPFLEEKIRKLKETNKEFEKDLLNMPLNVNDINAEVMLNNLNKTYHKIERIIKEIDW